VNFVASVEQGESPPRFRPRHRATLSLIVVCLLALAFASTAIAASAPTVTITSPVVGATVKGTVRIEADATAGAGAYPTGVTFYDGVNEIEHVRCEAQQSCIATTEWNATGLSGQHSLTAEVETNEGATARSAAVPVTVISPPPTVTIVSPSAGATVEGTIDIVANAATDPSQEDYPTEIDFYDGVNHIGQIDCQGQQTCQGQVEWLATGLTGPHTLTAVVTTHRDVSVTSAPTTVTVLSPAPSVTITRPRNGAPLGGTIALAVAGATARSQVDYPTEIDVYDGSNEIGSVRCQGQRTCEGSLKWNTSGLKGAQALKAVIHTNTDREATSRTVYIGGSPHTPPMKISCKIDSLDIRVGRYDYGRCIISNPPKEVSVVIQDRLPGQSWTSGKRVRERARGHFPFKLRDIRRETFEVSALIRASNHPAARILLGTVRVT
jgi:hypothetical protein